MNGPRRRCAWCGRWLPDGCNPERKYCNSTHSKAAQDRRAALRKAGRLDILAVCEAKTPFPSPQAAEKVIRSRGAGIGTAYQCGGHWHITRRPVNAGKGWRAAYES